MLFGSSKDDIWYTPVHALNPIAPFIDPQKIIWEPACGMGNLVRAFHEFGFDKVIGTDILTHHDFLTTFFEADYIITNPPFTLKNDFLARCYQLGKPFALLLPINALESQRRQMMFRQGLEVITFPSRLRFKSPNGKTENSPFQAVAWFTNGLHIKDRQDLLPDGYELLTFERQRYMRTGLRNGIEERDEHGRRRIDCVACDRKGTSEAGFGLCFKCYRREKRAQKPKTHMHAQGQQREQVRVIKLYGQMMTAAASLGMDDDDVRQLQMLLQPYLQVVPRLLKTADISFLFDDESEDPNSVNSSQAVA
jgi:hypothetical protein